jgi:hypothetical protein
VPTYSDRTTGETFPDAFAMVDAYLARFSERSGTPLSALDENGYTMARKGSANIAVNVLDEHGVLLLLAPVMTVPKTGREAFYRRLLELSFLTTGLDYEEFEVLLETVGRVADEWDDTLKREFGTVSPG